MSPPKNSSTPSGAPSLKRASVDTLQDRNNTKHKTDSRRPGGKLKKVGHAVVNILAGVPKGQDPVDSSAQSNPENANGPYGTFWLSKCKPII